MSSLSCHQGARKAHPYGENLDSWVENKVLHGSIYSSITQRLFSNIQWGQRLTTSERGSVVLALFVSKKSQTNLFLVLDPRYHSSFKMVFVHVVFVVTLKLHRQGKKVSLPSLKFCHIFFSAEYRSYSVFVSLLCDMWHNILHFPSSSSCHSIQDTAVEQTHAARIEEKPSMPNVTCLTTGQHLVLLWKKISNMMRNEDIISQDISTASLLSCQFSFLSFHLLSMGLTHGLQDWYCEITKLSKPKACWVLHSLAQLGSHHFCRGISR